MCLLTPPTTGLTGKTRFTQQNNKVVVQVEYFWQGGYGREVSWRDATADDLMNNRFEIKLTLS